MSMKKFDLAEREVDGTAVIDIIGELTMGGGTDVILEKVQGKIAAGERLLLINMGQCRRVDSHGLGELVKCLITAARHDAHLLLTNVPSQILGIMKLTNLHKSFDIYDTEEAALEGK